MVNARVNRCALLRSGLAAWLPALLLLGCEGSGQAEDAPPSPVTETPPEPPSAWLVDTTDELGIDFIYRAGKKPDVLHLPEIIGGGVGLLDYDGDEDLDIIFTNGNELLPNAGRGEGLGNRLYRQEADGSFTDVSAEVGIDDTGYGMGVAIADVDNDGDLDVYFTNYGPDRLYLNLGDGAFEDVTERIDLAVGGWSTSASFVDYDEDGDLDLFVVRYVEYDPDRQCFDSVGRPTYCAPKAYYATGDVLLRNDSDADGVRFTDVTVEAGIMAEPAAGLGVTCADFDGDGDLDIFVANDGYANHLWLNRGDGSFRESAAVLGVAYNLHGQAEAGMGVLARDLDGDLDLDLFLTHLSEETNTFYTFEGGAYFDETAVRGLAIGSMPLTGFGVEAIDLELDGDLDLAIVNGRVSRREPRSDASVGEPWSWLAEPNSMYLNAGGGRFESGDGSFAAWITPVEVSRGLAAGDIDRDGDLDFVLCNIESPARVYRNDAPSEGRWLSVRAVDPRFNRDAYHARVLVEAAGQSWIGMIDPGHSYLASGEARAHFGLGMADRIDRVEIHWPDGLKERFDIDCIDCSVELRRGEGTDVQ